MRLFAISDLHLGYGVDKPMHVFGPQWENHGERIRAAWDAMVGPADWMLVGGDTSWGLTLDQALPDLRWLGERPGTKILIKGNHCTWWTSRNKLERVIDPSIRLLQNNAVRMPDDTVVVGTRLWDPPDAAWADAGAAKIFQRELGRLQLSIAAGEKLGGRRRIALIHYPPRFSDGRQTAAVPLLEAFGVSLCVYGHLHGADCARGFQGEANGIRYVLASCDAIGFAPIELALPDPRPAAAAAT